MKMMKNTSWYVNCEVMEMEYTILDGREKMDIQDIIRLLKNTYWADRRSDCCTFRSSINGSEMRNRFWNRV